MALAVGVLLLGLAGPRTMAALDLLPGNAVVAMAQSGLPVGPAKFEAAVGTRLASNQRVPSARNWAEVGDILYRRAKLAGLFRAQGQAYLEASIDANRAAVALNPAAPYVWARLARAKLVRSGRGQAAALPLEMSIRTGAYASHGLILARLEIGLIMWQSLDDDLRSLLVEQIHIAANTTPGRLAKIAARTNTGVFVRHALEGEPALLAEFDRLYIDN